MSDNAYSIASLRAREVLDSRGNPTVEVDVLLGGGAVGTAIVPSGASTGAHEAVELRDGGPRYRGKGVTRAVENVAGPLRSAIAGRDASDLEAIDAALREADGTKNLGRLGANAVLGASLAVAHAAAAAAGAPLYRFLGERLGAREWRLPVPMLNVLNGGAHADNGLDVQEVMVAPVASPTFSEAIRAGAEIYGALKALLAERGQTTAVGDEGGFAPRLSGNEEAIATVVEAVRKAGYEPGRDVGIALDVAATEFWKDGAYRFERRARTADEMIRTYEGWLDRHPIYTVE